MKKVLFLAGLLSCMHGLHAQSVEERLQSAYTNFGKDPQLAYATSSLYVIDAATGKSVFDRNSRTGLAPASTQKVITSVTAFELLGKDFAYHTKIYFNGPLKKDTLWGDLVIRGAGDPTLGSWRYVATKRERVLADILRLLQAKGIRCIVGDLVVDERNFDYATTPDGWIWQDIGNYYGAGSAALNWNENQYDLVLDPGEKENDPVQIVKTVPELEVNTITNELTTGPKGSGDNVYIYFAPYTYNGFVRGTAPAGEKGFSVSGSMPYPATQFNAEMKTAMEKNGIEFRGSLRTTLIFFNNKQSFDYDDTPVGSIASPTLDSIIFWFDRKSINLYGEALVKTFALEKEGRGTTDEGVRIVKDFWKEKGLDPRELNMSDGSGLSPLNRVTTHAQVEVLKYAKTREWFASFYAALPEFNAMKMKSGTIRDSKAFCGYQRAADGKEYIFSFIVNNYNGPASSLVNKMYKVLDQLK